MWSITALKNLKCREFNSPLRKMIFFFVQVNYYKLFIYACILFNDKKQSKVMSNLSKITLNFWTVCNSYNFLPKLQHSTVIESAIVWQFSIQKTDIQTLHVPLISRDIWGAFTVFTHAKLYIPSWELSLINCSLLLTAFYHFMIYMHIKKAYNE